MHRQLLRLISRIPLDLHRRIAHGLQIAALFFGGLGLIGILDFFEKKTETTTGHLMWKHTDVQIRSFGERFPSLLGGMAAFAAAGVCIYLALRLLGLQGSLSKYEAILTGVETIKIHQIATIAGVNPSKVCDDIQTLIDTGMIEDFYIDYGAEQVVSKRYVPKTSHKTVVTCTRCGGNNELIVGITRTCNSCGEPLTMRA